MKKLTFPEAVISLRFQIRIFKLKVMENPLSARKHEKIIKSCRLWSALAFFCGIIALQMVKILLYFRCFFLFSLFFFNLTILKSAIFSPSCYVYESEYEITNVFKAPCSHSAPSKFSLYVLLILTFLADVSCYFII